MNQILYTETNKKTKGPIEIRKIVLFFSIAIIVFGVVLLGQGSYAVYKQNQENKINNTIPNIEIEIQEEKAKIKVTHDKVISQLIYTLNDEQEQIVQGNGTTTIEKEVELKVGDNIINVEAIDVNGKKAEKQVSGIKVETELKIELSVIGNKIKITATDTKEGMSYLTYQWNNENEQRVEANQENQNVIEIEADIPVGQNTLKINAVNKKNIVKTKEQEVKGVKKPEISAYQEGEYIVITVKDEEKLKSIQHDVNGQTTEIENIEGQKEVTYKQQMVDGDNYITVTATSTSGAKTVFYGVCKQ